MDFIDKLKTGGLISAIILIVVGGIGFGLLKVAAFIKYVFGG